MKKFTDHTPPHTHVVLDDITVKKKLFFYDWYFVDLVNGVGLVDIGAADERKSSVITGFIGSNSTSAAALLVDLVELVELVELVLFENVVTL